jgi:L-lactate dehydrogenase complex protein LldG
MLERIRKALGRPPGASQVHPRTEWPDLGAVLPPIAPGELVSKFEEELGKVSGSAYRAATRQGLEGIIRQILAAFEGAGVVFSRNPLLTQLGLREQLQVWGKEVAVWPSGAAAEKAQARQEFRERSFAATVGITGVDYVLAESGTLVLSSLTEGAQLASLAPPVHVALYRRGQVLGTLEEVLERLPVPRGPQTPVPSRSVVFVTGPSRTADIEQILIRGVHGPREVHAILVEDSCLG